MLIVLIFFFNFFLVMVLNKNYNQTKWQLAPGSQRRERQIKTKKKKYEQNSLQNKSSLQNNQIQII